MVAAKLLGCLDVRLDTAANGLEAVAAAAGQAYDAILMDMRMPEMDGLDATRAIRASGGPSAKAAIIAFTANAFSEDIDACMKCGMDGFISKPVRKQHLFDALAKAMADRSCKPAAVVDSPASAPCQADAVIDLTQVKELEAEIGSDGVAEMIASFLQETEERLSLLKSIAEQQANEQLNREAHTVKGTAGIFGAVALANAARQLEYASKSGCSADEASRLTSIVISRFHEAKAFLLRNL